MAEVVDSIIAELIARDNGYTKTFNEAIAVHERFTRSIPKIGGALGVSEADAKRYADRHKSAANDVVKSEEQTTERVKRTRKARTDASIASDEREVASAKKAAKEKADAEIAEAERSARYRALADRAVAGAGVKPGSGRNIGITVPREGSGQRGIPLAVLAGGADAAAEGEVNHLLQDRARLQAALLTTSGDDLRVVKEKVAELAIVNRLTKAGANDAEIALALDRRALVVEAERAAVARKRSLQAAGEAGRGLGLPGVGSGAAAIGGLAVAAGVASSVAAVSNAVDYAKAIHTQAEELGITTQALQVYKAAADGLGVSQEQLSTGLGQLSANLGKAQQGGEEQAKVFRALDIDIGNARTGFKSIGDILPTIIDRLSSIPDPARRAAVETALFGEQGRRLDGLLSGGIDKINGLADAMARAGGTLSDGDIRKLDEAGRVLATVKRELEVDIARIVAGNAGAIEGLATSFGNLVDNIGNAIRRIQEFNNQQIRNLGGDQNGIPTNAFARQIDAPVLALRAATLGKLFTPPQNVQFQNAEGLSTADDPIAQRFKGIGVPQPGAVNQRLLNTLNAPKPPKGPKGKSADQVEAERLDRDRRFTADERRAQVERLGLLSDLTADTRQQDEFARQRVRLEQEAFAKETRDQADATIARQKLKGADAAVVKSRAEQLIAADAANGDLEIQRINRGDALRYENEQLAHVRTASGIQTDLLSLQLGLARTAGERRDIELRLLDIATEQEKADLQKLIDSKATDPADLPDLIKRRDAIDGRANAQRAVIDQQNQGPLGDYLSSLPQTAADVDEALQRAAVHGLQNLNDGLTQTLSKFLGLRGAAGDFLSDLIKIGLQILQNAAFQSGGAGASGGAGGVSGFVASVGKVLGFAGGGSMVIGGNPGVDRNSLALNGRQIGNVGQGEVLAVLPNVAAANARVAAPQSSTVLVVQPIHADFSGARTDEQTLRAFTDYADARSRQARDEAIKVAGQQAPGLVAKKQIFGPG